jgi:hypothetical protein
VIERNEPFGEILPAIRHMFAFFGHLAPNPGNYSGNWLKINNNCRNFRSILYN